ncbi:MAG: helix-turn-helix transcriptional regulator [bacterium]|nr:helix-turn-helix transcriptional regulator [bacterium]
MKNQLTKTLGENVRRIRKQRNLKQEELAELIGLEVKSLSLIETGNGFASAKTLEKLSSVLKTPVSQLFEEQDSKSPENIYSSVLSNLELIKNNSKKLEALNIVLKELI